MTTEQVENSQSHEIKEKERKGHFRIDWGRQGGVILGYVVVLLGYYGIIANMVMFDVYGNWISFEDLLLYSRMKIVMPGEQLPTGLSNTGLVPELVFLAGRDVLFWTFLSYLPTYFLPPLLLFLVCFFLTYKEDIPHYGIKASIWLVVLLIAEGFIFYALMFGFSTEPIMLKFGSIWGYLDILILFWIAITGAVAGMKLKKRVNRRRKV
jgi:hypothetical protein